MSTDYGLESVKLDMENLEFCYLLFRAAKMPGILFKNGKPGICLEI